MSQSNLVALAKARRASFGLPRGCESSSLKFSSAPATSSSPKPALVLNNSFLANPAPANPPPAKPVEASAWSASVDVALIAILEAPLHAGETVALGFARKEAELRHVLATLSIVESRAMQLRLSRPKDGDPLTKAFLRLTGERRERLLNFIADARRREALGR
jgi:hypothetical protein